MKEKLIVVVGPTASGKSALAVRLARRFKGEVISADSRQIYRHLTIGTAKISKKEMRGIPHHLLDGAHPRTTYTVFEFKRDAERLIREIAERSRIPIIVGGTAFWVDALISGFAFPNVPPNPRIRAELQKKSPEALFRILKKLSPARAKTIDPKNPRRLIRAIEIARAIGPVPQLSTSSPYRALWIGIRPQDETLKRQISLRAKEMIRRGLLKETHALLAKGLVKKRIREFGFEYRAALDFLEKKMTRAELHARLTRDTLAYAKRQMRWFKRNPVIHWFSRPPQSLSRTSWCRNFLRS